MQDGGIGQIRGESRERRACFVISSIRRKLYFVIFGVL